MPHRGYSDEENECLRRLVKRNGLKPAGWVKTDRAFNRQFGNPKRTNGALRSEFYRLKRIGGGKRHHRNGKSTWLRLKTWGDRVLARAGTLGAEVAALRAESRKLRGEMKSLRVRAEAAEAANRRIEQALGAAKRRAQGAAVVHSRG